MELDVGDADGTPGEEDGNGGQVLEPGEGRGRAAWSDREVCEAADRCREDHAPVGDTLFAAFQEETGSLLVLCESKETS